MRKEIIKEILSYIVIIVVVLLIKRYIISPVKVTGDSMNPTLKDWDIMLLNEIGYSINGVKRFDIVVVYYGNTMLIKRVIGMPGDTVRFEDNKLYINGEYVEEPFDHEVTHNYELEGVIPEGKYFVVGDNRPNSKDSRYIGLVTDKMIRGKIIKTVLFPFSRMGKVK